MEVAVVNVQAPEAANPARTAYDRVRSLERIIKNTRDYADVLASDDVGRADEATELRAHADDLAAKAKTIVDGLTGNTQAAAAPASDPLPLPSLDFSK
jgi:hypothetical protein